MKIEMRVPKDYVGKVEEYTDREDNYPYPYKSSIDLIIDLFKDGDKVVLTEAAVNIYNMSSTNLLLDRINKKTAHSIAGFLEEHYRGGKENERKDLCGHN